MEKKNYYFTKTKIKINGMNGYKRYFVTNKSDIKYLGGIKSKYTSFTIPEFKKFMKEMYNIDANIKLV
jgi:hypothetical protein